MASCTADTCALGRVCVPSRGPVPAEILLMGEAPGKEELAEGKPFVGASGRLLADLLSRAGLDQNLLRIVNVCGCVDLDDPTPKPKEIAACKKRRDAQVAEAKPKVIVLLGNTAISVYYTGYRVGQIVGTARALPDGTVLLPTYHPSASLHSGHKHDETILEALRLAKRIALEVGEYAGAAQG